MSLTGKTLAAIATLSAWLFTTQVQAQISITNPSDASDIEIAELQDVEFDAAGYATTDLIDISVSYDGGATYNLLETGKTINELTLNNYQWDVGAPAQNGVWLKITNVTNQTGTFKDSVQVNILAPSISFGYTYDPSCGSVDGEIALDGGIYGIFYDLYYTQDGIPVGPISIEQTEGIYISALPSGNYTNIYIEYDGVQSNSIDTTLVEQLPEISYTLSDNTNCSSSNGSIDVSETGGLSDYIVEYYVGTDTTIAPFAKDTLYYLSTVGEFSLAPDVYTIVITDFYSPVCVVLDTVIINDVPNAPVVNPGVVGYINVSTTGGNDGVLGLDSAVTGASGSYSYQWYLGSDNSTPLADSTSVRIEGLSEGDYTVEITDSENGCITTETFTVLGPPVLSDVAVTKPWSESFELTATVDQNVTLYYVVTQSSISPTATQIIAGTDEEDIAAELSGSFSNVSGTSSFEIGPVAPETFYNVYVVVDNVDRQVSAVASDTLTTTQLPGNALLSTVPLPGGEIYQGSTNNLIYQYRIVASGGPIEILGFFLQDTTLNYAQSDFTNFTFYESIGVDDFANATELGTTLFALNDPLGIPDGSVGMTYPNRIYDGGDTIYYYVAADVSPTATVGNSIDFDQPAEEGYFAFEEANLLDAFDNGLAAGSTFTIAEAIPDVTIQTLPLSNADLEQGAQDALIYKFSYMASGDTISPTGAGLYLEGAFDSLDFAQDGFEVFYSVDADDFASATPLNIDSYGANVPGGVGVAPSPTLQDGETYYFYVTADISPAATVGNSFNVALPVIENFGIADPKNKLDGGLSAGSTFTIVENAIDFPGSALQFDGVDDQVVLSNHVLQNWADFTIEMWMKVPAASSSQYNYFEQVDANGSGQPQILIAGVYQGSPYFFIRTTDGGSGGSIQNGTTINDDTWHHVAYVRSDTIISIYIDGVLDGTANMLTGDITFPANGVEAKLAGDAALDEVKFWAFAKTDFSDRTTPLLGNESDLLGYYQLDEGSGTLTLDQSTAANHGTLTNFNFTAGSNWITSGVPLDGQPPVVTVNLLATSETSPELGGMIDDPSASIEVEVNGNTYSATNNGTSWTIVSGTIAALADGIYDVAVTATDSVGNVGTDTTTDELLIDSTAPIITLGDLLTNDISPELTGTINDVNASITVIAEGANYAATNNGDSTWTLAQGSIADLSEGVYTFEAFAIDSLGNADTTTAVITIDLTSPIITATDIYTNDISPELTGTINDVNASITVIAEGANYAATNNGDSTWTLAQGSIADLSEGVYTVEAIATDPTGNADTTTAVITIDLTSPAVAVDSVETLQDRPSLSGTVNDTSAVVEVIVDGGSYTATNNGDGTWALAQGTIASLAVGTYDVAVTATDEAGNTGSDSTTDELTILPGAPTAIAASEVGYFGFTAQWNARAGVESYQVDVSADAGFGSNLSGYDNLSVNASETGLVVLGLTYGQTYYYRVRAVYPSSDISENSNVISVTTLLDPNTVLDSLALMSIYDALDGSNWTNNNWMSGANLPDWSGVTMTDTRVTGLDLTDQNLTGDFPEITVGLESLTNLDLSDNQITSIPALTSLTSLTTLTVTNNRLEFGSLEANAGVTNFDYLPQDSVSTYIETLEQQGTDYLIDRTISGSANSYSWFKQDLVSGEVSAVSETGGSWTLSISDFSDEGAYYAEVTNSTVTGTLTTQPIVLKVSSLERDFAALRNIYTKMNGASWDWTGNNWDEETDQTAWEGVAISTDPERVVGLELPDFNITGTLPRDILDIQGLTTIDLGGNRISTVPDFSRLSNLTTLDISGNNLEFDDLEKNMDLAAPTFSYGDQRLVGTAVRDTIPVGSTYQVKATVGGTANVYSWTLENDLDTAQLDNSASTIDIPSLSYETQGRYRATVTSTLVPNLTLTVRSTVVMATANLEFTALDLDGQPFIDGEAYALKATKTSSGYDTIQTVRGAGTGFLFEELLLADYLIAVAPDDLDEYLPTYYSNTDLWTEADTIELREDFSEELLMAQIPPPPGTVGAKIEGGVEADLPDKPVDSGDRIDARRKVKRAGCSVRRFVPKGRTDQEDEEGEYVLYAYVQSDDEGRFEFTGLEDGKYRFNIEYPGIPMDPDSYVEFTIGGDGIEDEVLVLQATVTEDGIVVEKIERLGFYRKYFKDLSVYPNPADNYVQISYSKLMSATVEVRLIDLEGNVVSQQVIEKGYDKELTFDVSGVSGGIYLLNFVDTSEGAAKITTFKVYVKHH
ncbi:Ig-like domain-containing protein [Marinoscillum sp.]|uniref:Ig-like domain-containing protein n=1 Tax=Marinoscillum sp. TaxID=2024838 RepID=UPI003BA94AB5